MTFRRYFLGCPSWGLKDWVGRLYRRGTAQRDYLRQYATVFHTVEGNTTFYSVPSTVSVERWRDATPESFRFCFKLPQTITHHRHLENADDELAAFLDRLAPLGERLGLFMIQLPPSFGPDRLAVLERFLRTLPQDFAFAVELRHSGFYTSDDVARRADDLLRKHHCERIILDTRALRSGDPGHPDVLAARRKKPDLPVRPVALGRQPLLRLINHPEAAVNAPWLAGWAETLAEWIDQGRRPHVFIHCPNDVHSPAIARHLHQLLARRVDVGEMPPWPGEAPEEGSRQLALF